MTTYMQVEQTINKQTNNKHPPSERLLLCIASDSLVSDDALKQILNVKERVRGDAGARR